MEIVIIIISILGVAGTIYFGLRSKQVERAFTRYVDLEKEVDRLKDSDSEKTDTIKKLKAQKEDIYRHKYEPKSKVFKPGDAVKLTKLPENRGWISGNSKIGMTGIIVDYGPGTYEYTVYWSEADYSGEPVDQHGNRWQAFYVNQNNIERIKA